MTRDANEIAREHARQSFRSELQPPYPPSPVRPKVVWGTLSVWDTLEDMNEAYAPVNQSLNVHIQIKDSGVIVAYDEQGDAQIFYPKPGWYVEFVPNREGE